MNWSCFANQRKEVEAMIKEYEQIKVSKRSPLFNCLHPNILFGPPDPNKLKPAFIYRKPLLPACH